MGIFDKAKELGERVNESVTAFSSDEVIANTVIKAVEKQEKVNAILKARGCNYRVADIDLGMGIPPTVTFGVRRVDVLAEKRLMKMVS
ncbi:hypothetical protein ACJJIE_14590 [Microbulbifer sp. TRSA001]|uniref:hypothetical protein n=1 Tax=unclassified Microbulbifer TaxID=2619833 RepID=UPI0024AE0A16|nr:hypothetical protein [Microbulbifer sp. VAAF005]WHI45350.1 hypothetical protein P0078_16660 [Microbulbifer sp. VAAF005]